MRSMPTWVQNLQAVVKSVGPKLVPFFKTVAIYFVVFIPDNQPSWYAVVLKCLPIISLMFFVLWHMKSIGQRWTYSRLILAGLFCSCIGDACLVYDDSFLSGITAFAVAHVCYLSAFGIKPFAPKLMILMAGIHLSTLYMMWSSLHGPLTIVMPMYGILVTMTAYRAIDGFISRPPRVEWDGGKLCAAIGGALFLISDSLIGLHFFHSPIPYHQVFIMLTYYAAQLGIALSVVNSMEICPPENYPGVATVPCN